MIHKAKSSNNFLFSSFYVLCFFTISSENYNTLPSVLLHISCICLNEHYPAFIISALKDLQERNNRGEPDGVCDIIHILLSAYNLPSSSVHSFLFVLIHSCISLNTVSSALPDATPLFLSHRPASTSSQLHPISIQPTLNSHCNVAHPATSYSTATPSMHTTAHHISLHDLSCVPPFSQINPAHHAASPRPVPHPIKPPSLYTPSYRLIPTPSPTHVALTCRGLSRLDPIWAK